MSFFLSVAAIGICIDFATTYETTNSIIIIPNPKIILDDSSENIDWLLPIIAASAPAITPIATRSQNILFSPFLVRDSSVGVETGDPAGLSFISLPVSDFSSSFFFGCRTN